MKRFLSLSLLLCAFFCLSCGGSNDNGGGTSNGGSSGTGGSSGSGTEAPLVAQLPKKNNPMKVLAHFMIWFESNTSNPQNAGKWGWHWTMNASLNPTAGEIAAWYHPLTGPYASGDADILDYQCLLMKYAGIDGVIVDWYGSKADNSMAQHTSNTEALFKAIKKAGLQFSICYEDQALPDDYLTQARADMTYLGKTFFSSDNYTKIDGRPLLLDFGPQKVTQPKDWTRIFQVLSTKPEFIVLNGNTARANDAENQNSQGEFLWVNADPASWYKSAQGKFPLVMGGAMPGFKDYYKQGNSGDGYTTYDAENGALFDRQLKAAKDAGLGWLQISTWNDYGEGTVIEPTKEDGYRYLNKLQTFTGVGYQQSNLELIYEWYQLKKKYASNAGKKVTLQKCYDYLNALQPDKARELMKGL